MFSKNKNQTDSSAPLYIHTMKDDLINPYTGPSTSTTPSETKTTTTPPITPSPSQPSSSTSHSPFLSNTPSPVVTPTPSYPQPTPKNDVLKPSFQASPKPQELPKDSPFDTETPKQTSSKIPTLTNNAISNKPESEYTIEASQATHSGKKKFTAIISLILILVVAIVGIGGYFYWQMSQPQTLPTLQPAETTSTAPEPIEQPVTITPLNEKYSFTNPNVITFDVETVTQGKIAEKLSQLATEIQTMTPAPIKPVEFIINDQNNTPLAFQRFTTLAGIKFPPTLLAALDEKFSLYVFIDEGVARTGLSIAVKDSAIALTEALKEETNLLLDLNPLFINGKPTETTAIFKDGSYNNYAVRYANLSNQSNLSLDYSINATNMFIGTSKNTLRAIIDANSQVQTPSEITTNTTSSAASVTPQE